MEGWWWLVVGEMRPLLTFEAMEGWRWLVVDEMSPLLAFEVMEGQWCWWWVRRGPSLHLR